MNCISKTLAFFLLGTTAIGSKSVAQTPQLDVQTAYPWSIEHIAFSPDGKILAASGGIVKLWDVASGIELRTLTGFVTHVMAVTFSPDGNTIVTASGDGLIFREVTSGKVLQRLAPRDSFYGVAYTPDGQKLVSLSGDSIQVWDVATGKEIRKIPNKLQGDAFAVTPDNKVIVSYEGHGLRMLDLITGEEAGVLSIPGEKINKVALSPDGKTLVSGSEEKTVRLWDLRTAQQIRSFPPHQAKIYDVAFNPQSKLVASSSEDKTVKLWNSVTGGQNLTFKGPAAETYCLAFSPDGRFLATGDVNRAITLWDVSSGKQLRVMQGSPGEITAVQISPTKAFLASGDKGGVIRLWDLARKEVRTLRGHSDEILTLAFSPDDTLLASGSTDKSARLWDVNTGKEIRTLPQTAVVGCVAFAPDGSLATATFDDFVRLWNTASGAEIRSFQGKGNVTSTNCVAFSPDGKTMASVTSGEILNRAVELWDIQTGNEIRTLTPGHAGDITSIAFHPSGHVIASRGMWDGVKLWDVDSGKLIQSLSTSGGGRQQVAFSADGSFMATAGDLGHYRIWDLQTLHLAHTIDVEQGEAMSFSGDGKLLAVSNGPGIDLWNPDTGQKLITLYGFPDGDWAALDPEGRYDAARAGHVSWLHWVVANEPIDLDQLKERYYEPGLLSKITGFNREPLRDVSAFASVALFPAIDLVPPRPGNPKLGIRLMNRGGGIGRVDITVNGKEITSDARSQGFDENSKDAQLVVDLTNCAYLKIGEKNDIDVRVYNKDGYLSSRGERLFYQPSGVAPQAGPSFWAIVAGISEYSSPDLRLRYASKDAEDMAQALQIGAERLFGSDRVHMTLLTAPVATGGALAIRDSLRRAFEQARVASPKDIFVVYLAGHGVTYGGAEGDYYFLTQEARTGDLTDPSIREESAISSAELTEWIRAVPATKQILVLDTCGAARLVEKLTEKRAVSSSQIRSLERMKDRTGLYILAGSAADAVSYEASRYAQGLLTYSLLLGMRGGALREEQFVDVSKWFDFAVDQVPELARGIGGIQRPLMATPFGGTSFDIGEIAPDERSRIRIRDVLPLFVRSSFQEETALQDTLKLGSQVNDVLSTASSVQPRPKLVFIDTSEMPESYSIAGRYRITGVAVEITVFVFHSGEKIADFTVKGSTSGVDTLANNVVQQVQLAIQIAH